MTSQVKTAVLFPGQGSQTPEMRELVARVRPDLLELACDAVGGDPFERVEESTAYAQPAIFCAALAGWELVRSREFPIALAGHSLGELAALVAAGAIGESDGVRLAAERGRLMADARSGAMLAVRASYEEAGELVAGTEAVLANHNAPRQVVIAGPEAAIATVEERCRERAIGTRRLAVKGAFHSPLMAEASERFAAVLAEVEVREPGVPVICGATAAPFSDVRRELAEAIVRPVRFVDVVAELRRRGVERFVEVGPGRVLQGLVRRIDASVETVGPPVAEGVGG